MRRKLLFLGVLLSLLVATLVPAPVFASSSHTATQFTAVAEVVVTNPGHSIPLGSRVITRGEVIQGVFTSVAGWDAMVGASLTVRHNSSITLSPVGPTGVGTFEGEASALVTVTPPGGGRLVGTYRATLYGEYTLAPGVGLVVLWVVDSGTFKVTGAVPDGHGMVKASGDWDASLVLTPVGDGFTLAGSALLSGQYRTRP